MTPKQAANIRLGARIRWCDPTTPLDTTSGTVVEKGYNSFKIKWDDGLFIIVHNNEALVQLIVIDHP